MAQCASFATPAIYAIGFFSLSLEPIFGLLIPLWALELKVRSAAIGVIVGFGSLLPTIFSIPIGAVADRVGAKTILVFSGAGAACLIALYPLARDPWLLLLLHMLVGLFQTLVWVAAQAYAATFGPDQQRARLMANFGSATTLGAFVGPLLMGYLLDRWGFRATFFASSLWAFMVTLMAFLVPASGRGVSLGPSDLLPRWSDYKKALSLFALPAVLVVIVGTFLRLSVFAIRGSYYPVYLKSIHFPAFSIGILASVAGLSSSFSAPAVGRLVRFIQPVHLLLFGLSLAIIPLAATPTFDAFLPILALSTLSGAGIGFTLPLLLSILAHATGPEVRGLSAGLRTATNRLASTTVPIVLGLVIHEIGLAPGFYLIGVVQMLAVGGFSLYVQARYLRSA